MNKQLRQQKHIEHDGNVFLAHAMSQKCKYGK